MIETLDIFKTTDDILERWMSDGIVNNIPKRLYYPTYPFILEAVLDMQKYIYYANTHPEERAENLKQCLGELQRLKSLTRHAHKSRMINNKQDAILNKLYDSVSKQATAWRKKTMSNQKNNNTSYDMRESQG